MVCNKTKISKNTGLSRTTISEILNGKQKNPKLETLEKLANALNCSLDELKQQIKETG